MWAAEQNELALTRPAWRVLGSSLRPVVFVVASVGYALALGATGVRLTLMAAFLLVAFGWIAVVSVLSGIAVVTGSDPAITPEGVRVRVRSWQRRTILLPWSELDAVWVGYSGRRAYLCIRTRSAAVPASGAPVAVFLPATVTPDTARSAIKRLSGGALTLWNHDPEQPPGDAPSGRRRVRFSDCPRPTAQVVVSLIVMLLIWLVGIPAALDLPQVWHQPWWPGQ